MKKILRYNSLFKQLGIILCFIFSFLNSAFPQAGEWTWIHGDSIQNSLGNLGVQGIPNATNNPHALYEPCEWTDLNGNFWLFGGFGSVGAGASADLWKYNSFTNEWTWMKGPGIPNAPGHYGTLGTPSSANYPPARGCSATWTDNQGNLWLFSGITLGGGSPNDLWKYNIATNQWTWVNGAWSTSWVYPVYGTQGVTAPFNNPGTRSEVTATWVDSIGNLWLFGGESEPPGSLNDLWKYNITTHRWTWMKGSSTSDSPGIHGAFGVEDSSYTPGARYAYTHWKDNSGNFWLFGGVLWDIFNHTFYNDLWRYNPTSNKWAWMGGGTSPGIYGSMCSTTNLISIPAPTYENRAVWTDHYGNFWVFGGASASTGGNSLITYNALWMYCMNSNRWIYVSGDSVSNSAGNWGTLEVSSSLNKPSARFGSVGWADRRGHLYLFGGTASPFPTLYKDLWKFSIDYSCGGCVNFPFSSFTSSTLETCSGNCIRFDNLSQQANSFQWSFAGGSPSTDTSANPPDICYTVPGSYDVTLITTNANGNDTLTLHNYITVFPNPTPFAIQRNLDTLFAPQGFAIYQWSYNSNPITGATNYYYFANQNGNYSIHATDSNGCSIDTGALFLAFAVNDLDNSNSDYELFPNPVRDELTLISHSLTGKTEIRFCNALGEQVFHTEKQFSLKENWLQISTVDFANGIYFYEIKTKEGKIFNGKIMKQ